MVSRGAKTKENYDIIGIYLGVFEEKNLANEEIKKTHLATFFTEKIIRNFLMPAVDYYE